MTHRREITCGTPSVKGRARQGHRVTSHPQHPNAHCLVWQCSLPRPRLGAETWVALTHPETVPGTWRPFQFFNCVLGQEWHRNSCVCHFFFCPGSLVGRVGLMKGLRRCLPPLLPTSTISVNIQMVSFAFSSSASSRWAREIKMLLLKWV